MTGKIGFLADRFENSTAKESTSSWEATVVPRKSVVQVHFPSRNMTLSYYNDRFDLQCGDLVYVDGKLEGHRGRVVDVNYNFKIKLSDYKRVISVVDTDVRGKFYLAGSHFVTFDRTTFPVSKAETWFKAPAAEEEEYASGSDEHSFWLEDLSEMKVSNAIFERGLDYYKENRVRYLCLDDTRGRAIVEGSQAYDVEFEYRDGEISGLTCDCFCGGSCKHEVATMLQLRETLEHIVKHYRDEYDETGYFSAVHKGTFFVFAIDGKNNGSFSL